VTETFVHEESGEPEEHMVLAVFSSLADANMLANDRAEEVRQLAKKQHEEGEVSGFEYWVKESEGKNGEKRFEVGWGCCTTVKVERFVVRQGPWERVDLGKLRVSYMPERG
jgi:hypothetical protein